MGAQALKRAELGECHVAPSFGNVVMPLSQRAKERKHSACNEKSEARKGFALKLKRQAALVINRKRALPSCMHQPVAAADLF